MSQALVTHINVDLDLKRTSVKRLYAAFDDLTSAGRNVEWCGGLRTEAAVLTSTICDAHDLNRVARWILDAEGDGMDASSMRTFEALRLGGRIPHALHGRHDKPHHDRNYPDHNQ